MMKTICSALIAILVSLTASTALAEGKGEPDKYYLFIGHMDHLPIKNFIENPRDSFPGYAEEVKAMGGKLHSYYWSVKEPTMYAIVSFPSHKEAAAQVYQRRGFDGIVNDIELIEIFTSEQMVEVFELANEYTEILTKRVEAAEAGK